MKTEKKSFEDAMAELEEIVYSLEKGNIHLDEAMEKYETAIALKEHCQKMLDDAQLRITELEKKSTTHTKES